jgi:1-acyl-sn-glycerol-3-phosphate acyltransferase
MLLMVVHSNIMKAKIKVPKRLTPEMKRKAEEFFFRLAPGAMMTLMAKYFRLTIEGAENIPRTGPVIIAPNHSGFSGLDAMILAHQIRQITGRQPRILTHNFWFKARITAVPAQKLGFIEATFANGLKILRKRQPIVLFPEGELGNFKPTIRAYDLQEFKRGFIRMAILAGSPIVPTLVIGAEETNINLAQLALSRVFRGLRLPLPLNILPLPVKWKIVFLPPVDLPYAPESADDAELARELADEIRTSMQTALNRELRRRKSIFF